MPSQKGPDYFTGTIGGICYYQLNGKYYARRKSTLSGKRVKQSPAFRLTMVYAGLMASASRIAAEVYRSLPRDKRKHALYRALTGQAMQLLKAGTEPALVAEQLWQSCATAAASARRAVTRSKVLSPTLQTKYARIFIHPSMRISATGIAEAHADKARRRLLGSVQERA